MSDYLSIEEIENKLSLIIRKAQEGKTFICIENIINDTTSIHIIATMNTLSAGMQFFGRMEEKIGSKKIIVFNSKKQTAGNCFHAKTVGDVLILIKSNPEIRVIVCCAHTIRIKKSIGEIIKLAGDSLPFIRSNRTIKIHIDEAHTYIPPARDCIRTYNASPIVSAIIGYSATPDKVWTKDDSDTLFGKILIRNVERELQMIRSPNYCGVNQCEFHIFEEEMTHDEIVSNANINPTISQVVSVRANMTESNHDTFFDTTWCFDLGNELLLLSYISQIILRMEIPGDSFSYHFVPGYTRKATHYELVEMLLKLCPTANVITVNGNGTALYRNHPSTNKSYRVKSGNQILEDSTNEERKGLIEPSMMVQELIKETPNCPTFVTGFLCVSMSVTLINEVIGNFDSVIMAHQHYNKAILYQLCRFVFNHHNWSPEQRSKIKTTKFYSLTKLVVDTVLEYEEHVEHMSTEYAGKTCSLSEIEGREPEELSAREIKKSDLKSITLINLNNKIWKKFKVYDGNDAEEWKKAELFYELIRNKKLSEKSKSRPKCIDGFFHCSTTTEGREKKSINEINKLDKQSWWSTLVLNSESLSYTRIFIGYDNLDDPSEYTIFIKYAQLEDTEKNKSILQKYY